MSDKPISPLRQRMIDDMTARRFKEKVQKDYVRHVRTFAAFLGRSALMSVTVDRDPNVGLRAIVRAAVGAEKMKEALDRYAFRSNVSQG
jgi:hypothetical protein